MRYLKEQHARLPPLNYDVKTEQLCPETASKWVASELDEGTDEFLAEYCAGEEGCTTNLMGQFLRLFYSLTDSNAILQRGQMHVLSSMQLRMLLQPELDRHFLPQPATLLDIGAGDGNVTKKLSPFLRADHESHQSEEWKERVVTTELSHYMVKRLREQGFACAETTTITREALLPFLRCGERGPTQPAFDIITLFNVIDRCDRPLTLLRDIKELLLPLDRTATDTSGGLLILAVVFPWGPFVEDGSQQKEPTEKLPACSARLNWPVPQCNLGPEVRERHQVPPDEPLSHRHVPICQTNNRSDCACCTSFERCVDWFVWNTLVPQGWDILRWTRVPYISAGDMHCPYYALDNAVFVLRPATYHGHHTDPQDIEEEIPEAAPSHKMFDLDYGYVHGFSLVYGDKIVVPWAHYDLRQVLHRRRLASDSGQYRTLLPHPKCKWIQE